MQNEISSQEEIIVGEKFNFETATEENEMAYRKTERDKMKGSNRIAVSVNRRRIIKEEEDIFTESDSDMEPHTVNQDIEDSILNELESVTETKQDYIEFQTTRSGCFPKTSVSSKPDDTSQNTEATSRIGIANRDPDSFDGVIYNIRRGDIIDPNSRGPENFQVAVETRGVQEIVQLQSDALNH
jgi:uncharacterized protein YjcR